MRVELHAIEVVHEVLHHAPSKLVGTELIKRRLGGVVHRLGAVQPCDDEVFALQTQQYC